MILIRGLVAREGQQNSPTRVLRLKQASGCGSTCILATLGITNKKVQILLYKGFQPIVNSERISTKCDFRNTISTLHVTFKDMKKLCTFDSLEMHTIRL